MSLACRWASRLTTASRPLYTSTISNRRQWVIKTAGQSADSTSVTSSLLSGERLLFLIAEHWWTAITTLLISRLTCTSRMHYPFVMTSMTKSAHGLLRNDVTVLVIVLLWIWLVFIAHWFQNRCPSVQSAVTAAYACDLTSPTCYCSSFCSFPIRGRLVQAPPLDGSRYENTA